MSQYRLWMLSLIWLTFSAAYVGSARASENLQVLVIHSYGPQSVWVKGIQKGLSATVPEDITLHHVYLDTKHLPTAHHAESAESGWNTFLELSPQLVVICDDNAMRLLGEKISREVPTVFCGINSNIRAEYPWVIDGRQITGVMERPLIRRAAFMIDKVVDFNANRALILLGSSTTANAIFKHDLGGQRESLIWGELQAEVRVTDNFESLKAEVRQSLNENFDFMVIAGHQAMRDQSGRAVALEEVNRWISANAPIPPFTIHSNSIGAGKLIGGLILLGETMGRETGQLVANVIESGLSTRDHPVVSYDHGRIVLSKAEVARWGIGVRDEFVGQVHFVE